MKSMETSYKTAWNHASKVKGWLSEVQGQELYRLAQCSSGAGVIVEIGSWQGKSTIMLASACKAAGQGKVYAVDPFEGYQYEQKDNPQLQPMLNRLQQTETYTAFKKNTDAASVSSWITPIKATSEEAYKKYKGGEIGLLFIDGNHDEAYVRLDVKLWEPLLAAGGFIAFDDAKPGGIWPGPPKVAAELFGTGRFEDIRNIGGMAVGRKIR